MANITSKSSKSFPEFIVALSCPFSQRTDIKITPIWKGYYELLTFLNAHNLKHAEPPSKKIITK